jgi:arylsulfatase
VLGGSLAGGWRAALFVLENQYVRYGMTWISLESFVDRVNPGFLSGGAFGVGAGLLMILVVIPALRSLGRSIEFRLVTIDSASRERVWATIVGLLAAVGISIAGLYALNTYFIPWKYTPRYWITNIGWSAGSLIGLLVLYRGLSNGRFGRRSARRLYTASLVLAGGCLLALLALNAVYQIGRPRLPENRRSIFLLTVDTLRADHLGSYGYSRSTSPNLDRLAAAGRLYTKAYSHAPHTSSSFSSIMTGFHPRETGTYQNDPFRPKMNSLAEYLKNAGYRTGAIVSNYVLRKGRNHEHGFDHFDDRMDDAETVRGLPERIGERTTAAALSWLRQNTGQPVFLWVHFQDPHGPYTPPEEYEDLFPGEYEPGSALRVNDDVRGQGGIPSYQVLEHRREYGYYVAQYDAEIRYFDQSLHDLVSGIKELGLWDESLVIFTSDHGEGMGEHDYYFAHGDQLYPGLLHVPLILWVPDDPASPGRRDSTIVQSSDIAPTVLSFAGIEPATPLPGRDLLSPGSPVGDAVVFSETLRSDNYKCSLIAGGGIQIVYDQFNGDFRLYDMVNARYSEDIAGIEPVRIAELSKALEALRNPNARGGSSQRSPADAAEIEKLKSLGYVR